jgi:predicted secreted Zn-dependent protease
VQDLVCFLSDLFKGLERKIVILEGEAKKLSKKLISLKYNMDDCKVVATETQEGFDLVKSRL